MPDEIEELSFRQLHALALWLNGLVVVLLVVWILVMLVDPYGALLGIILTLALGTLGNFIGLVVCLATGRGAQAIAYGLGLAVVGGMLYAYWTGISNSRFGKPGG
jgi:hypothetical protein